MFSAAWRPGVSPARTLWTLDVTLVSSAYAITEAARNLDDPATRARFYRLIQTIDIADEAPPGATLPPQIELPDKDRPILLAAIHAGCTHLLTGDARHFGPWFGQSVSGVRILTVRNYLTTRHAS